MLRRLTTAWCVWLLASPGLAAEPLPEQASAALRKAVAFYHGTVATHGGYVYRYSADLSKREGEGKTTLDTVWVQPPGTPSVGLAFLEAYERTGDPALLAAAKDAGDCLLQGQYHSGGWNDRVDFAPELRAKKQYRVDPLKKRGFNVSTYDDDKTQSALRFLMQLDRALKFEDQPIHEATLFALDSVLKSQFPNGAWAQGYEHPLEPEKYPVKPASFPESWPPKYPGGDYWWFYTFNDNAIADTIEMLLLADRVYHDPRYRAAALKAGDFIILSQLPEPQPAWAQQYNFEMHPCWARKFEPPAISGGETQGIIAVLLKLYQETGDKKFLAPIPPALAWLKRSEIAPGKVARFYELQTNKPLYLTRTYELTFADNDLPTHYSFQLGSNADRLQREFERVSQLSAKELMDYQRREDKPAKISRKLEEQVQAIIAAMDERGAWVEDGRLSYHGKGDTTNRVIESRTFVKNLDVLSRYLQAVAAAGQKP